jgi:ectoine hydroxylase-related dioxygenase (phytanoyl-CoA dioxygenase family)
MSSFLATPAAEPAVGTRSSTGVAEAVMRLRVDGYAILADVIDPVLVQNWRRAMGPLLERFTRTWDANRGARRWCMRLPFASPFDDPAFSAHPTVLAVVRALLGEDIICGLFTSDTPLPGAEEQAVHRDIGPLFPGLGIPLPPSAIVLNIPLVDYTDENGPMEIWPGGTHHAPADADPVRWAATMPSRRLCIRAGSLLLRDLRTWHRGTPNRSEAPRTNLTATYTPSWFRLLEVPVTLSATAFRSLTGEQLRLFRYARVVPDVDEERVREWNDNAQHR